MGRGPYRPSNQPVSVQSAPDPTPNPYMDATIGAITNPGVAGPTMNMPAPDGATAAPASTNGGYDAGLMAQFDAIGKQNGRTWRPDEYAQWLGPSGYLSKDDINGSGEAIKAWTPGAEIDPYWQWRIGTHARGDYNGDNPAELGAGDANMNKGKGNQANAAMTATAGTDSLLSGDPFARIQDALGKVNGQGQVNLDALLRQLQGV